MLTARYSWRRTRVSVTRYPISPSTPRPCTDKPSMVAARISSHLLLGLCALIGGCSIGRGMLPAPPSLSTGEWVGLTSQGQLIAFTVSPDEKVTRIEVGYDFADCFGTLSFEDLDVPTNPNVTCIPGPCSGTLLSYRAFGYSDIVRIGNASTQINGLFLPRNQARGQVIFRDFGGCGSATAQWTATRR